MSQIFISKNNSTVIPLDANQTFIGIKDILTSYQEVDINISGAPNNAGAILYFEFSPDGVHWDVSVPLVLSGPDSTPIILRTILPYFRVKYENGNIALTELRLTTVFHRSGAMRLTRFINQPIDENEPVEIVRVAKSELPDGASTESTLLNVVGVLNSIDGYVSNITGGSADLSTIEDIISGLATETTLQTKASESTLASRLSESTFITRVNTLGQKNISGSVSVVLASDQAAIPTSPGVNTDKILYDIQELIIYVGTAPQGSASNNSVWRIKKTTLDIDGNPISQTTSSSTAIWDNRASETYS